MRHKLRRVALNLLTDSPIESIARKVYGRLTRSPAVKMDRQTVEVMRRCLTPQSNCIDVGGYRGEVLRDILKLAPNGTHYVFEPVPRNYKYLSHKYPDVHVFDIALSDKKGESVFCEVASRPARSGLRRVKYPSDSEEIREIKVKTDLLDNLIPPEQQIDLIKIDVEGAEYHVFKGAEQLIRRCRPVIIFEHGVNVAAAYDSAPELIHDLLHDSYGMELALMGRWLAGAPSLNKEDFCGLCYREESSYFMAHGPA